MLEKIVAKKLGAMEDSGSRSTSATEFLSDVQFLNDGTNINLGKAVAGYIKLMKQKDRVLSDVVAAIDARVSEMEDNYKTVFAVGSIDYSDTDTESSSGCDSPETAKRPRSNISGGTKERYFTSLERQLKKLIINNDRLYPNDILKKCALRAIFKISQLRRSDVEPFIVPI